MSPNFQIAQQNYYTSISSDLGLGTENPRGLGTWAIFAIFQILIFFKSRVFLHHSADFFNYKIIKNRLISFWGLVDKF